MKSIAAILLVIFIVATYADVSDKQRDQPRRPLQKAIDNGGPFLVFLPQRDGQQTAGENSDEPGRPCTEGA